MKLKNNFYSFFVYLFFFFCLFLTCIKWLILVLKKYAENCVHNIIDKEKKLQLRNKDIGEKLGIENIYDLIDKEIKDKFDTNNSKEQQSENIRHGSELINDEKFMYNHEDIITSIIMHCRVSTPKAIKFRSKLGFKQDDIMLKKEQSAL